MKKAAFKIPERILIFAPYFAMLKPVKWQFSGAILFALLNGATNGFGVPVIVYKVLPKVFASGQPDGWMLAGVVVLFPLIGLVRGASDFFSSYLSAVCGVRVLIQIQSRLYRKLQELPLGFYGKMRIGDLMSRVMGDTAAVQTVVTNNVADLVRQPVQFIGAIAALVYISIQKKEVVFILFALAVVPLCIMPIRYFGKRMKARAKKLQASAGSLSTAINENLGAVREVRAFNLQELETAKFAERMSVIAKFHLKKTKYSKMLPPLIELIGICFVGLGVLYCARVHVTLEDMVPLLLALYMTYPSIRKFGTVHNDIRQGEASVERIEQVMQTPDAVPDPAVPVPFNAKNTDIEFENVGFEYEAGVPVLCQVNAQIPSGTVVALVGPSGAGKSTFVNLIPRFYDVTGGAIRIGGIDLRQFSKIDLRNHMAIVSQDTILFNDTIRNNIRLGRQDASDAEVEQAARHAFAHDFITAFDEGYNTMVGERGTRLSGGQKQRIAIARAFLRNAPVLILDEATSALDSESEEMVQKALVELVKGRTVFIIAHRFSTIKLANRIMVFERGILRSYGSHPELYASDELYKSLYDRQFIE
ncbi:MAG TPA: ABC transporter ATP-binding protein [Pontiellaceae bacterium]|nr:ABC transporter ATP-binding protein [Pontiellaceae bacterium]